MKIPLLSLALLLALSGQARAVEVNPASGRPDLTGRVVDSAGAAVPAATVMILAAGPRVGNSALCPYCYADCGKKTASDAQGQFRLPSLDPALDFCIIALATGYEPFINSKLVPEAGPVTVKLRARDLSTVPSARHVFGRIMGPDGAPVVGATIDVEGVESPAGTRWGGNDATEPMTISDANGEFHLVGHKDFTAVQAIVEAPGLAKRWARLEPGKTLLLRMKVGATVRGRLALDGQPLANTTLGLATAERECGKYFNGLQIATNGEGRFVLQNVPGGLKFQLFGLMDSLRGRGAAFRADFTSPADGGSLDLGELAAKPACRLQGHIVLADGKPLPPNTRLMIDRLLAWDTTLVPVRGDGSFEVTGVPPESIHLNLQLPGYRLAATNPNLDPENRRDLVGRVNNDLTGMQILLEPGRPPDWNDLDHPSYEDVQKAAQLALRGMP